MSDARRPRDRLTDKGIRAIAGQHGFDSIEATEKWIMDFETCRLVRKFIPNCTARAAWRYPSTLAAPRAG